jgi:preprotein translocase subunit SecF
MIDFVGKKRWFFLVSAVLIIVGIIFLAILGLNWGEDFKSGTSITLRFDKEVDLAQLRQELADLGYGSVYPQRNKGVPREFFIALPTISSDQYDELKAGLETGLAANITDSSIYTVSPIIASTTVRNTIIAIIIASIGILLYISWAFRKMPKPFRWGICAILALLHDLIIVIAVFSLLGWASGMKVDSLFVAGVLAIVGISVNNIVVVFDRIRENLKRGVSSDFAVVANCGIMESVGRSLNTGLATLFVIVALYLLGGVTIQNLILALLVGITTGIYSSLCIAGQLLVVWEKGDWSALLPWSKKTA